ncbi:MAG: hypothetical protein PWP46_2040 [Fusobacteriaceae bacterium]|jgi:hypothetical protein|nr:hypothetical protein [Fusobacteriales bacterium]MDN5305154.1 hypothetical protein [Fusobacteriaceae bacterium]
MKELQLNGITELNEEEMMMIDGGKWRYGFTRGLNMPSLIPSITKGKKKGHYTISLSVGIGTLDMSTDNGGRSDYYDKLSSKDKKSVIWPSWGI